MAPTDVLRPEIEDLVGDFYEAVSKTAHFKTPGPISAILLDWIEARAAPVQNETAGLLSALSTFKRVLWKHITLN